MNCLIVDDNKIARTVLKYLVGKLSFLKLVGDCEDVMQATSIMNNQKVDLLLLDVEMPGITGFEFLRSFPKHPLTILITAKPEYALEAFEYNVVDFLVKPVKEDRFLKAIHRAKEVFDSNIKMLEMTKEYFFIREKGTSSKLVMSEILYVQAMGDYAVIHTVDKKYTVHYTLSALEKELPMSKFMRVHRSYLVALDKIDTVEEGTAFVYQVPVPVSDNSRAELMKRLNQL